MRRRIFGVGDPGGGDNRIGLVVARDVNAILGDRVVVKEMYDPMELVGGLDGVDEAIIIEAVSGDEAPGTVLLLTPEQHRDGYLSVSTAHNWSVRSALGMAEIINSGLPKTVIVGICIDHTRQPSDLLSPRIEAARNEACLMVRNLV